MTFSTMDTLHESIISYVEKGVSQGSSLLQLLLALDMNTLFNKMKDILGLVVQAYADNILFSHKFKKCA